MQVEELKAILEIIDEDLDVLKCVDIPSEYMSASEQNKQIEDERLASGDRGKLALAARNSPAAVTSMSAACVLLEPPEAYKAVPRRVLGLDRQVRDTS